MDLKQIVSGLVFLYATQVGAVSQGKQLSVPVTVDKNYTFIDPFKIGSEGFSSYNKKLIYELREMFKDCDCRYKKVLCSSDSLKTFKNNRDGFLN